LRRRRQRRTEALPSFIVGRRCTAVLTQRAPAPSPDEVGRRIALSRTFVAPAFTAEVSLLHQVCQVACSKE
jgi:hypothetical protein